MSQSRAVDAVRAFAGLLLDTYKSLERYRGADVARARRALIALAAHLAETGKWDRGFTRRQLELYLDHAGLGGESKRIARSLELAVLALSPEEVEEAAGEALDEMVSDYEKEYGASVRYSVYTSGHSIVTELETMNEQGVYTKHRYIYAEV